MVPALNNQFFLLLLLLLVIKGIFQLLLLFFNLEGQYPGSWLSLIFSSGCIGSWGNMQRPVGLNYLNRNLWSL